MNYYVYWTIQDTPSNSIDSKTIFFIIGIACIVLWVLVKKYRRPNKSDYDKVILLWASGIIAGFSMLMFSLLQFVFVVNSKSEVTKILNSSNTRVVEGMISDFRRKVEYKRFGTVTTESFFVDSLSFIYSDALLGRFNTFSETDNDIVYNGLHVRITYVKGNGSYQNNWILKIEVGAK